MNLLDGEINLKTVGTSSGFCSQTAEVWQFLGIVLLIFKIVIPVILIVLGMIDLGKAVISSDDKAISTSVKTLAKRIIAAIVIFFIPTIISAIFYLVESFKTDAGADYEVCRQCIVHPRSGKCAVK